VRAQSRSEESWDVEVGGTVISYRSAGSKSHLVNFDRRGVWITTDLKNGIGRDGTIEGL
jgi:hypothetical protein